MARAQGALALSVALTVLGCSSRPASEDPVKVFEAFAKAVQARDAEAAWGFLSSPSQRLLAERTKLVAEASGGSIPDNPRALLLQSGLKAREIEGVVLAGMSGERSTVEVASGGVTQRVDLVREGGQWRVDVSPIVAGLEHGE